MINGISLYAQESYRIQIGSLNCPGLASCAITECADLPSCTGKREGDFWIQCKREGCKQLAPDAIGQVMTLCDYNCVKEPLPFLYDFNEMIKPFYPGLVVFDCAGIGTVCAVVNAMRQGKQIPIKRAFAYACVGGLWGLNCFLSFNKQPAEKLLYAFGGTLVMGIASEYFLNKMS